jgi:hypothetical protein
MAAPKKPRKRPVVDAALHPVIQSPPERHIVTEREDEDPDEGGMTAEKAAALIPREYG